MRRTCKRFMFFMVLTMALIGMNATVALAKQKKSVKFTSLKKISISQFDSGLYSVGLNAKYSGKYMIANIAVVNNTKYAHRKTKGLRVVVYYNNQRILDKRVKDRKFKIGKYAIKKMKVKVSLPKKLQKAYPLSAQAMRILLGGQLLS